MLLQTLCIFTFTSHKYIQKHKDTAMQWLKVHYAYTYSIILEESFELLSEQNTKQERHKVKSVHLICVYLFDYSNGDFSYQYMNSKGVTIQYIPKMFAAIKSFSSGESICTKWPPIARQIS